MINMKEMVMMIYYLMMKIGLLIVKEKNVLMKMVISLENLKTEVELILVIKDSVMLNYGLVLINVPILTVPLIPVSLKEKIWKNL